MTNEMNNLTINTSLPNLAIVDVPRLVVSNEIYHVDFNGKMSETVLEDFANSIEPLCEARTRSYLPHESTKKLVRITFLPKIGMISVIKGIACIHSIDIKPIFIPDHFYFMVSIPRDQEIPQSVLNHVRHVLLKNDDKMIIEMSDKKTLTDSEIGRTISDMANKYQINSATVAYCRMVH
jgi:hypothetical protein